MPYVLILAVFATFATTLALCSASATVERWGMQEVTLTQAKDYDNPFIDAWLKDRLECADEAIDVTGFYDGDRTWKIRFMPTREGEWRYSTSSKDSGLDR